MAADAGASDDAAEQTAAEFKVFVMKGTSGERERDEPPDGSLSTRTAQTRSGPTLAFRRNVSG
jgi:hypothetical protein